MSFERMKADVTAAIPAPGTDSAAVRNTLFLQGPERGCDGDITITEVIDYL